MTTPVIVSYDGTSNDDDALALGRMLAVGGAKLSLAYVRHSREYDPGGRRSAPMTPTAAWTTGRCGSRSPRSSAMW